MFCPSCLTKMYSLWKDHRRCTKAALAFSQVSWYKLLWIQDVLMLYIDTMYIQYNILFFTKTHPIHLPILCTDMVRQKLRVFSNAWVYPSYCLTNDNWSFDLVFVCQYVKYTLVFLITLYILQVYDCAIRVIMQTYLV